MKKALFRTGNGAQKQKHKDLFNFTWIHPWTILAWEAQKKYYKEAKLNEIRIHAHSANWTWKFIAKKTQKN